MLKDLYYELPFSNHHTNLNSVDISIDDTLSTLLIREGPGGKIINTYDVNSLHALEFGTTIRIIIRDSDKIQFDAIPLDATYVDGVLVTQVLSTAVNELNSVFTQTGGASGLAPVITSATTINITTGDSINYELTATNGVSYEWDGLPAGVFAINGNVRFLIGGTLLAPGTYTPTMTAINYYGNDIKTLTIIVSSPPFSNTKSIRFNNNDYLTALATTGNPLYRLTNGTGASDAWTISFWFQRGTSSSSAQTILSFGGDDQNNDGRIQLNYRGSGLSKRLELQYGSNNNNITLQTPIFSVPADWISVIITYDGGTTGAASGSVNDYYSRFGIWIDNVSQTLTGTNDNYGFTGEIEADKFYIGRRTGSGGYMKNNCHVDELALWDSDQTANVAAIYGTGSPKDLSTLGTPPDHWWRMGDGDVFPILEDIVGVLDFTMTNMTIADIVNNVPP